jgi:hypothetical protein
VAELKSAVSGALGRFTSGDISADQLMAYLGAMGVELRCRWVGWVVTAAAAAAAAGLCGGSCSRNLSSSSSRGEELRSCACEQPALLGVRRLVCRQLHRAACWWSAAALNLWCHAREPTHCVDTEFCWRLRSRRKESLESLPDQLNSARSSHERLK